MLKDLKIRHLKKKIVLHCLSRGVCGVPCVTKKLSASNCIQLATISPTSAWLSRLKNFSGCAFCVSSYHLNH